MARKARNVEGRCAQVLSWLCSEYPCGREVRISWRKELGRGKVKWDGETIREGAIMRITLSRTQNRQYKIALDTLIHEYTHCIQWGMASVENHEKLKHHPAAFWAQYGEISDRFNHDHGAEESKEF